MAQEEFIVRITRKGEILVELDPNLPARRIKDLMSYFEETLGPVVVYEATGPDDAPSRVELDERMGREEEEDVVRERDRLREREE